MLPIHAVIEPLKAALAAGNAAVLAAPPGAGKTSILEGTLDALLYLEKKLTAAEGSAATPARCEIALDAVPGGTRVTSRSTYVRPEDLQAVMDMGMLQGITETWDRLAEHLA